MTDDDNSLLLLFWTQLNLCSNLVTFLFSITAWYFNANCTKNSFLAAVKLAGWTLLLSADVCNKVAMVTKHDMLRDLLQPKNDNLLHYGSRLQAGLVQHRHTYNKIWLVTLTLEKHTPRLLWITAMMLQLIVLLQTDWVSSLTSHCDT